MTSFFLFSTFKCLDQLFPIETMGFSLIFMGARVPLLIYILGCPPSQDAIVANEGFFIGIPY